MLDKAAFVNQEPLRFVPLQWEEQAGLVYGGQRGMDSLAGPYLTPVCGWVCPLSSGTSSDATSSLVF